MLTCKHLADEGSEKQVVLWSSVALHLVYLTELQRVGEVTLSGLSSCLTYLDISQEQASCKENAVLCDYSTFLLN